MSRNFSDWLCALHVTACADFVVAAGEAGDGFGVGDVLFDEDALGEGVGVVRIEDGDRALEDDGAMIEVLVDEVDGAAGDFDSVIERLLLGVEARECGQQRGMDIEDAVGEGGDEAGREQAHVTGEADEVDVVSAEADNEVGVVLGAGAAFGDEYGGGEVEVAGGGDALCFGGVGEDDGDFDVVEAAFADGAGNGKEVGAAAGEEDAEAQGRARTLVALNLRVGI